MDIVDFEEKARQIRKNIIEQVYSAKSGHLGGSLSIADIMTVLYFKELNIDENNPKWEKRDRLVLSKGHCTPALYASLAERGFFEKEKLKELKLITEQIKNIQIKDTELAKNMENLKNDIFLKTSVLHKRIIEAFPNLDIKKQNPQLAEIKAKIHEKFVAKLEKKIEKKKNKKSVKN